MRKDVREEVVLRLVLHGHWIAVSVLGRHDVEDMKHGRAIDEERRLSEVAAGADPSPEAERVVNGVSGQPVLVCT